MAEFRVILKRSAAARLEAIEPSDERRKLRWKLAALTGGPNPLVAQRLHGYSDRYRLRYGPYRVLYHVDVLKKVITIIGVGYRRR